MNKYSIIYRKKMLTRLGKKRWLRRFLSAYAREKVPMKRMSESMKTSEYDLETKLVGQCVPSSAHPPSKQLCSLTQPGPIATREPFKKHFSA